MDPKKLMEMKLTEVSDYLLSRMCESGDSQVGVELKGRDDETDELMVLTVFLRKEVKE